MRREADLVLVVACSLALTIIILAFPFAKPARVVLGLPFVLFSPGYALTAALFPRKDDLAPIERIALSLGLSIATVSLIGLSVNYSPWGIRLNSILVFVTLFIVLAAAAALAQRRMLPVNEAFSVTIDIHLPRWSQVPLADRLLTVGMVLALIALGVTAYLAATSRGSPESFTEFYVLGPDGKAEDYNSQLKVGESATVTLGIVNHEGQDTAHRVAVKIDGETTDSIDNLVLADGDRWEGRVALTPTRAGDGQKVEFLLYKDGGSEPYRSLRLFLNVPGYVPGALAEAVRPPEEAPSAIGEQGVLTYVVQPGDTLASLAERFGLSPEAIATANGLTESEPLPVGKELVIPTVIYIVQPGDTLYDIAVAFDVSLEVIIAVNGITDRSTVYSGQELAIPVGGAAAEAVRPPEEAPSPTPSPERTPTDVVALSGTGEQGVLAYVVQPGDTLTMLAERFGLSPEAIATPNGLAESESLLAGMELAIPTVIYIVQPGDTLYDIAIAFDVSPEVIIAVNGIADRSTINAGQELAIPVG